MPKNICFQLRTWLGEHQVDQGLLMMNYLFVKKVQMEEELCGFHHMTLNLMNRVRLVSNKPIF